MTMYVDYQEFDRERVYKKATKCPYGCANTLQMILMTVFIGLFISWIFGNSTLMVDYNEQIACIINSDGMNPTCIVTTDNCTSDNIDKIFSPINITINEMLYMTCAMIAFLIITCLVIACCIQADTAIYGINYVFQIIMIVAETILFGQCIYTNYKISVIIDNSSCYILTNINVFNNLANSNNTICWILGLHLILSSLTIVLMAYIVVRYHLLLTKYHNIIL